MKEGEKRRIYIHPELGYGTRGRLPPNSLLIFDVEIVEAESDSDGGLQPPPDNGSQDELPVRDVDEDDSSKPKESETSYRWLKKIREAVF